MAAVRDLTFALAVTLGLQVSTPPPTLPAAAVAQLARSVQAAAAHVRHDWRDIPPMNADGTINGYIEIPRGERRKFEFDMAKNARRIDRIMPESVGGYPVNYGFVPQTVSYDGDPFDILVLGPALPGGREVRGIAVGLMHMEDEKGLDAKVVVSLVDANGRARHQLTEADKQRIGEFFKRYKDHEPGHFSRVPGWGSGDEGLAFVDMTHAFFEQCRQAAGDCRMTSGIAPPEAGQSNTAIASRSESAAWLTGGQRGGSR